MAKKRPGSGKKKRPSQSGSGRKPYVRKPPFGIDKAEALTERKFEAIARHLRKKYNAVTPRIDTRINMFKYQDGTMTADLDIIPLVPDLDVDDLLLELHGDRAKGIPGIDQSAVRGSWLSVGFFNPPAAIDIEKRADYKHIRGQLFYKTHSRRWEKKLAASIVEQARTSQKLFFEQNDALPTKIVVRSWWSPISKRPQRAIDKVKGKRDDS